MRIGNAEGIEGLVGGGQVILGGPQDVPFSASPYPQRLELEAIVHLQPGPVVVEMLDGRDPHFGHLPAVLADLFVGVAAVPLHVEFLAARQHGQPLGLLEGDRLADVVDHAIVSHVCFPPLSTQPKL